MEDRDERTQVTRPLLEKAGGTGAVIGGIAGLAAGLGALAIPGVGPAMAAGPLTIAIGSLGIGAAAGGLIGALTATPLPSETPHAASPIEPLEREPIEHPVMPETPSGSRVYVDGLEMEPHGIEPRELEPRASRYEDFEKDYHADFEARHLPGYTYEQFSPAYRYGYNLASDPRFVKEDWLSIEEYAQREWETHNPGSWDKVKEAVRYAWQSGRAGRTGA